MTFYTVVPGWVRKRYSILDLFIEYRLQMPVIAGFLVMRFLSGYTLVYTVF